MKKHGATNISLGQKEDPVSFARMIAKIAYSYAWAENQIDDIKSTSSIRSVILGHDTKIGKFVGTLHQPIESHEGVLHRILIHKDEEKGLMIAEVQLFSDSETPCYGVILGELK